LLTIYTQVAQTLSEVLGRKIDHVKLDEKSRIDGLVQAGLSDYFARFMTSLELMASNDSEKATSDIVQQFTGHPPKNFKTFFKENKSVWSA
jgi:hypothetical protein